MATLKKIRTTFGTHELILLFLVAAEGSLFNWSAPRFGSLDNTFDLLRHSVEIGLLALAMTPIILAGGIDLSIGSLLGLCAVVFGKLWRDWGLPPAVAAIGAIITGAICGLVNGALITQLRLPPLIVTVPNNPPSKSNCRCKFSEGFPRREIILSARPAKSNKPEME